MADRSDTPKTRTKSAIVISIDKGRRKPQTEDLLNHHWDECAEITEDWFLRIFELKKMAAMSNSDHPEIVTIAGLAKKAAIAEIAKVKDALRYGVPLGIRSRILLAKHPEILSEPWSS